MIRNLNQPPDRITLIGFHFLRRRAEERVKELHKLQRIAKRAVSPSQRVNADSSLRAKGVRIYDEFEIVKSGKYDCRYRVVAIRDR